MEVGGGRGRGRGRGRKMDLPMEAKIPKSTTCPSPPPVPESFQDFLGVPTNRPSVSPAEDPDYSLDPAEAPKFLTNKASYWMSDRKFVVQQLKLIVDEFYDAKVVPRIQDMPKPKPASVGTVVSGVIIQNPEDIYSPSEFYTILEHTDYSFENPDWAKYFPSFCSSPTRALDELTVLLNIFHKLASERSTTVSTAFVSEESNQNQNIARFGNGGFKFHRGDVVLVKFFNNATTPTSAQGSSGNEYQMRRGVILDFPMRDLSITKEPMYSVFLLDYGTKMKCTSKSIMTLPKPFDSIAPLAIQCALHGISPVGTGWSIQAKTEFSSLLDRCKPTTSTFLFTILSKTCELIDNPLFVSVDIIDASSLTHQYSLTQLLIDEKLGGIPWNLFPARPKLMATGGSSKRSSSKDIPGPTVSYRNALLLAPLLEYQLLPLSVINRELKTLLTLRRPHYQHRWQCYLTVPGPPKTDEDSVQSGKPAEKYLASGAPCGKTDSPKLATSSKRGEVRKSSSVKNDKFSHYRTPEDIKKDAQKMEIEDQNRSLLFRKNIRRCNMPPVRPFFPPDDDLF